MPTPWCQGGPYGGVVDKLYYDDTARVCTHRPPVANKKVCCRSVYVWRRVMSQAFATYRARLESADVKGKKCKNYIQDLIE